MKKAKENTFVKRQIEYNNRLVRQNPLAWFNVKDKVLESCKTCKSASLIVVTHKAAIVVMYSPKLI